MKLRLPRFFSALCVLCVSSQVFALDREAFTFTKYDLQVRIDPAQQRLGARGTVTLRNDSATPQRIAVLQISSSLSWRSIQLGGKRVQFVAQPFTSDIDHTGALSEAVVSLPQAVVPKSSVDLEIAYEGVIVPDATRLTRIGTPESFANSADWDQISAAFTAVRGAGNVAWYPIATEVADLSEGQDLQQVSLRWRQREADAAMHIQLSVTADQSPESEKPELLVNASNCSSSAEAGGQFVADCSYHSAGANAPTFVMANYASIDRAAIAVHFLPGHDNAAAIYADAAEKALPLITEWFGTPHGKAQAADLPDASALPYESGPLLLTPLTGTDAKVAGLAAAHQLTHAAFFSPRPWINEGLAHFAQALFLERESGRQAALAYLATHRPSPAETAAPHADHETHDSLINTADEQLYRSKAMSVWWMLRDLVGDAALKKAIAAYHPDDDKEPSYMQHLTQAQTQRDLEWFFDDWVYRDRGLPDFKVKSAFVRKTLPAGYLLTVTVQNLGGAGAEVPLVVKYEGGELMKRLEVHGKSEAVIRVETPKPPDEIVVNDGSVPESDVTNNVFKIETSSTP
ncbi:MAG TPA: hypothetical protein VND65_20335 [Candidatus Binatia bacterium]|nr:hypothetical protein [Candidatus Binatia bacterium]